MTPEAIKVRIEIAAKAGFECRPAFGSTASGGPRWTWENIDENTRSYWREIMAAALLAAEQTKAPPDRERLSARMLSDCIDWDGTEMSDAEYPRAQMTCGQIREAAAALRLPALEEVEAERNQALKIERLALAQVKETTAVMDEIAAERDRLRDALKPLAEVGKRYGYSYGPDTMVRVRLHLLRALSSPTPEGGK